MSDCSQPSSVSGAVVGRARYSSVCGSAGRLRCSSRRSRPRVASSGWPTARWLVSSRRAIAPWVPASARHSSSLGCGSHRCRSWWVASASSSSMSVHARRVCPNSDSRSWQVAGPFAQPGDGLLRGGCAGDRRRRAQPAPATVRAASAGRSSRSCGVAVQPVDEQLRAAAGRRRRTARPVGAPPHIAGPGAARPPRRCAKWPKCVASVRHHGSSRLQSITSSSGHVIASGDHGSSSTVPVTSAISEPGLRNATPAHTPSPPPGLQPSTCDSR